MKENEKYQHVTHMFEPIYDKNSKVLILGTFPSVKSREQSFYYAHPQNRFWKVLAKVTKQEVPQTVEEKKKFLLENHIAIWDVVGSCDIIGSSDSSICNVEVNDFSKILSEAPIRAICTNGNTANDIYLKYALMNTRWQVEKLPSTSPANAAWSLEKLQQKWEEVLKKYL